MCCTVRLSLVLWVLIFASGCGGDGLGRVEVSGTVTFSDQPVEDGQIRFVPQAVDQGPITIEPIKAGHYSCTHNGGVPAGTHRVEILAWDPNVPEPGGPGLPPRPQLLPPKYNVKSELVETIDGSAGAVEKNFKL